MRFKLIVISLIVAMGISGCTTDLNQVVDKESTNSIIYEGEELNLVDRDKANELKQEMLKELEELEDLNRESFQYESLASNYRRSLGIVQSISEINGEIILELEDMYQNTINFIITEDTYYLDGYEPKVGDYLNAFYDISLPATLVNPPKFDAYVIVESTTEYLNVKLADFGEGLVSKDAELKLDLSGLEDNGEPVKKKTIIEYIDGVEESDSLEGRTLLVLYKFTRGEFLEETRPIRVIVLK